MSATVGMELIARSNIDNPPTKWLKNPFSFDSNVADKSTFPFNGI